jgi:glycine cleavage system H lipoate-binding protein
MSCPFLKEANVRYCHGSSLRKLVAAEAGAGAAERCSTGGYTECRVYQDGKPPASSSDRCPFLQESLAHYCSAAPVRRFLPFTQQAGRCGGEGFRYCELYMAISRPVVPGDSPTVPHVRGVPVPTDLYYSPNHLWFHVGANRAVHMGIDAFFATVIGQVTQISFASKSGVQRPSAVLTAHGVDWPVSFGEALMIDAMNVYLRRDPSKLTADPYGAGWLFEGWEMPSSSGGITKGLMDGAQATAWFAHEFDRLDHFAHTLSPLANDGGAVSPDLMEHLSRDEILRLLDEFFAPHQTWAGFNR